MTLPLCFMEIRRGTVILQQVLHMWDGNKSQAERKLFFFLLQAFVLVNI